MTTVDFDYIISDCVGSDTLSCASWIELSQIAAITTMGSDEVSKEWVNPRDRSLSSDSDDRILLNRSLAVLKIIFSLSSIPMNAY